MSFQEQLQCLKPVAVLVSDQRSFSFHFYQEHGILKPLQPIISPQNQANSSPGPSLLHSISKCFRVTGVITGLWAIISSIKSSLSVEDRSVSYSIQSWSFDQQHKSVQSLNCVQLFAIPWTAAHQASLSITNSQSPPKPMSIKSVKPSSHLILCRPLLLLPSIFPSTRVFSNESALHIRWPK